MFNFKVLLDLRKGVKLATAYPTLGPPQLGAVGHVGRAEVRSKSLVGTLSVRRETEEVRGNVSNP